MADPHIRAQLDYWDMITVICYRCGFVLASIGVGLLPYQFPIAVILVLVATVLCASSLHIYLKHFRLLLQFATWVALVCQICGLTELALGGAFVTLGGLCFKEYFCFRILGLNLQPFFFAVLWVVVVMKIVILVQIMAAICAVLLLFLAIQKWRMPLHFDIGDKTKYQI